MIFIPFFQESHFLTGLGLKREDLEPKAEFCTQVYIWHTRTEKAGLHKPERVKFVNMTGLSDLERSAII
jgi:hypothetical protein